MGGDARVTLPLNGSWEIAPGERFAPPESWGSTIPVPSVVDCATPAYDHEAATYHWYRCVFAVPRTVRRDTAVLVIGQAMFGTAVWLNGRFAGEDIACYTSQEYDVSGTIRYGADNTLLVRVGSRSTLPPESAVGRDQERATFIPGIWGDVRLILSGSPRCSGVQVIPHCGSGEAEVRVMLAPGAPTAADVTVSTSIVERSGGRVVTGDIESPVVVHPAGETVITFRHQIRDAHLWSPDDPFLYRVETEVRVAGRPVDHVSTVFGMREFTIRNGHFLLNGERIFLRGGNIAFHRFLSDPQRGVLPWDPAWIRRVLIDIPKEHHFNFFRNHLGQMYGLWYDIADEHGMLLQNEWQFWTTTGSEEQIAKEFARWLRDNWNHPSIVIWDALNESTDAVVEQRIIPRMKELDPTRPWEPVDFTEDHPYIYSLGPVLHDRKFGFSRSLQDLAVSPTPVVVNEFLWWWLDPDGRPTSLTREVVERWVGPDANPEELEEHQRFLAAELVELFRRMRLDAIQPFVYLSNSQGPTAHWFLGPLSDPVPRPLMATLRNAFAPVGISLELWDRHFFPGETRRVMVHVMNDTARPFAGEVVFGFERPGAKRSVAGVFPVQVDASGHATLPLPYTFPDTEGPCNLTAVLRRGPDGNAIACSTKPGHVLAGPELPVELAQGALVAIDPRGEVEAFLREIGAPVLSTGAPGSLMRGVIVVVEEAVREEAYRDLLLPVTRHVHDGGTLVLIEPEHGVEGAATVQVLEGFDLRIIRRVDADAGGYDSYVFAGDHAHPLWRGIASVHLRMFNGGFGGVAVSQHDIMSPSAPVVHARSGLRLRNPVVMEWRVGGGRVIVARLQVRGRLQGEPGGDPLYGRRTDPVAQRFLLNLLAWASTTDRRVS